MEIHNSSMDLHDSCLIMDLHNWFMEIHNWYMEIHNSIYGDPKIDLYFIRRIVASHCGHILAYSIGQNELISFQQHQVLQHSWILLLLTFFSVCVCGGGGGGGGAFLFIYYRHIIIINQFHSFMQTVQDLPGKVKEFEFES